MTHLAKRAVRDSFVKLAPREQAKNPVMLMVYLSAILTLVLFVLSLFGITDSQPGFIIAISAVLWLTVLFANFAEALAEGRGKAQADSLRAAKRDIDAHKLNEGLVAKGTHADDPAEFFRLNAEEVSSAVLKKKDLFYVAANEQIPADGEIVMGAASVDESAITGESAPVIREAGGEYLKSCEVFDVYKGANIPEGKKSVAFNLVLRADDRSLTAEEADEDVKSILALLQTELGATLR